MAGSLMAFPVALNFCLLASGVSFLVATGIWIIERRRRDPYSLEDLRGLVLEGAYDESDIPEVDRDGDKYCMCCDRVYGARFGVCPTCGK